MLSFSMLRILPNMIPLLVVICSATTEAKSRCSESELQSAYSDSEKAKLVLQRGLSIRENSQLGAGKRIEILNEAMTKYRSLVRQMVRLQKECPNNMDVKENLRRARAGFKNSVRFHGCASVDMHLRKLGGEILVFNRGGLFSEVPQSTLQKAQRIFDDTKKAAFRSKRFKCKNPNVQKYMKEAKNLVIMISGRTRKKTKPKLLSSMFEPDLKKMAKLRPDCVARKLKACVDYSNEAIFAGATIKKDLVAAMDWACRKDPMPCMVLLIHFELKKDKSAFEVIKNRYCKHPVDNAKLCGYR